MTEKRGPGLDRHQFPRGQPLRVTRRQASLEEKREEKMTDSAVHEFFSNGCQYYIAGRYGAFAGLNTVVGNLLHHAIEHFLKGVLAKTKSLKELKKLLHNLPDIWDAFKAQVNDPTLAR